MKVSDLIEILEKMPKDSEVRYKDSYFDELSIENVRQYNMHRWKLAEREYELIPIVLLDADL